jgi:hypothetical protein
VKALQRPTQNSPKRPNQDPQAPPPRLPRSYAVRGDLTQFLAPGDTPLLDERLCACGHLEADHRLDGPCSRCRRCLEFATHPEDDVTAVLDGGAL